MNLKEISEKLGKVSDIYARKFSINRDNDWFVLKIQEELGELTNAHLKLSQRARMGNQTQVEVEQNLKDEIADVLALTLLFARHKGIDAEKAISEKWFKYL